jgi:hypothetical protein
MPILLKPASRGRPPQDPIDRLRTLVWVNALMERTGLPNGYALLTHFEPDRVDEDGITRDKKWVHYVKGRRVPSSINGFPSAVDIAEKACPGSSVYFHSALWRVLKKEKLKTTEIDGLLSSLGASVSAILQPKQKGPSNIDFKELDTEAASALADLGTFDALEAVVLLAAKAEAIASHDLKRLAQSAYLNMAKALVALREFSDIGQEVLMAVDTSCKHWIYPNNQSRLEVVIFSQGFIDEMERQDHEGKDVTQQIEE